jgi:putative exporter of polyketide antibiotics
MATVSKTRTYSTGGTLTASNYNADRDEIIAGVNSVTNAQIASDAGIEGSKLEATISNKTMSNNTALGSKATITVASGGVIDLNAGPIHSVTLGASNTLSITNSAIGKVFMLRIIQDATGSRTVTWFSTIKWIGGSAPTLSSSANAIDVFGFTCTGTNTYDGFIVGMGLA